MSDERPPFDSEHLTPVERDCERQLAKDKQSCHCCDNLKQHARSGATVCEEKQDIRAMLNGKRCNYFNSRKSK